jgi:hypothetical protein
MVSSSTFEVFSADCPLCRSVLRTLRTVIDRRKCGCTVTGHRCSGDVCYAPAQKYGVNAVPTIARDGTIVHVGKLTEQEAEALLPR